MVERPNPHTNASSESERYLDNSYIIALAFDLIVND